MNLNAALARGATIITVGVCLQTAHGSGSQQGQPPIFQSSVDVVPIYATVRDGSGRLIFDLEQSDFVLRVDGTPTEITVFSRDPQPLNLALMIDTSASVAGLGGTSRPAMERLRNSVLAFLHQLGPGDLATIGSFGAEVTAGGNLTRDPVEFDRVLTEELWGGGGTPLWEAIDAGIDRLAAAAGRRVVLVYSDGIDTGSIEGWNGDRKSVEVKANQSDAMIYFVRPPVKVASVTIPLPPDAVHLCDATGGGFLEIPADTNDGFDRIFSRVAEELRHQYLIGFAPEKGASAKHTIDLRLRRPGLQVRAKKTAFEGKK